MADAALKDFVRKALQAGATAAATREVLLQAGWPAAQVDDALQAYAPLAFVVPVPRPRPQLSARAAFAYLVMFSMLYLSVYHLGSLLFHYVELALPDAIDPRRRLLRLGSIRFSVATLLIAWPLFLLLATHITRAAQAQPAQRQSGVRQWLTWLTLAVAACVLAGDVIALLYRLLSGELSLRFLLKALIVATLAGSCFGYYFHLMNEDDRLSASSGSA